MPSMFTFFLLAFLVSAQWVESLPPACPRTSPARCPQMSALISTPSSRWTIWKSTRWRSTACTCSTTQTWSLPTRPQRKRFASTGSNNRSCTGVWMPWHRGGSVGLHLRGLKTERLSGARRRRPRQGRAVIPHRPTTIKPLKIAF